MVLLKSVFLSAALFSGFVSALPTNGETTRPAEIPVSAPDGTPRSDVPSSTAAGGNYGDAAKGGYGGDYGGYGGGYGGGYEMTTTTAEKSMETSSMMEDKMTSSTMMEESSSSMMHETMKEESTSTTSSSDSMPTYGSGKSDWGSGYDDCVQKCVATYGAPPGTYMPTATSGSEGSKGTGSTVTVIVAPTAGVLRYVPHAVNASVGTTVEFHWGAGPHTVTKSSALLPCNKSSENPSFSSGQQQKDFVFTQVVNDTNPTYYMCGVPGHCQKGMFGIINPPSSFGAPSSVGNMMQSMLANNSDLQAYAAYTANNTRGKAGANWGQNIDLGPMPGWSHDAVVENVMFTRNLLAMNPDIVKEDGSIDLSNTATVPLLIPQDLGGQINAAGSSGAGAAGNNQTPASAGTPTDSTTAAQPTKTNGASLMASPKVFVAIMAVVATFFAL